jgi:hypothetical protein
MSNLTRKQLMNAIDDGGILRNGEVVADELAAQCGVRVMIGEGGNFIIGTTPTMVKYLRNIRVALMKQAFSPIILPEVVLDELTNRNPLTMCDVGHHIAKIFDSPEMLRFFASAPLQTPRRDAQWAEYNGNFKNWMHRLYPTSYIGQLGLELHSSPFILRVIVGIVHKTIIALHKTTDVALFNECLIKNEYRVVRGVEHNPVVATVGEVLHLLNAGDDTSKKVHYLEEQLTDAGYEYYLCSHKPTGRVLETFSSLDEAISLCKKTISGGHGYLTVCRFAERPVMISDCNVVVSVGDYNGNTHVAFRVDGTKIHNKIK